MIREDCCMGDVMFLSCFLLPCPWLGLNLVLYHRPAACLRLLVFRILLVTLFSGSECSDYSFQVVYTALVCVFNARVCLSKCPCFPCLEIGVERWPRTGCVFPAVTPVWDKQTDVGLIRVSKRAD